MQFGKENECVCVWKYSDVTPFVIVNIFISNCNLITHFFSQYYSYFSDYSYIYFVIKMRCYM